MNKLIKIYDERYDEIFRKVFIKIADQAKTKNLMAQIFNDTKKKVISNKVTGESITIVFSQVMLSHGIVA